MKKYLQITVISLSVILLAWLAIAYSSSKIRSDRTELFIQESKSLLLNDKLSELQELITQANQEKQGENFKDYLQQLLRVKSNNSLQEYSRMKPEQLLQLRYKEYEGFKKTYSKEESHITDPELYQYFIDKLVKCFYAYEEDILSQTEKSLNDLLEDLDVRKNFFDLRIKKNPMLVNRLETLYYELLSFKDSASFAFWGFGGGPSSGGAQYSNWQTSAAELRKESEKSNFLDYDLRVAAGRLDQLGLTYVLEPDDPLIPLFKEDIERALKTKNQVAEKAKNFKQRLLADQEYASNQLKQIKNLRSKQEIYLYNGGRITGIKSADAVISKYAKPYIIRWHNTLYSKGLRQEELYIYSYATINEIERAATSIVAAKEAFERYNLHSVEVNFLAEDISEVKALTSVNVNVSYSPSRTSWYPEDPPYRTDEDLIWDVYSGYGKTLTKWFKMNLKSEVIENGFNEEKDQKQRGR